MSGAAPSTATEIYVHAHEHRAISTTLHAPKVWERFIDGFYSILERTHLENIFHHIKNLYQIIKPTMEGEKMEN